MRKRWHFWCWFAINFALMVPLSLGLFSGMPQGSNWVAYAVLPLVACLLYFLLSRCRAVFQSKRYWYTRCLWCLLWFYVVTLAYVLLLIVMVNVFNCPTNHLLEWLRGVAVTTFFVSLLAVFYWLPWYLLNLVVLFIYYRNA